MIWSTSNAIMRPRKMLGRGVVGGRKVPMTSPPRIQRCSLAPMEYLQPLAFGLVSLMALQMNDPEGPWSSGALGFASAGSTAPYLLSFALHNLSRQLRRHHPQPAA